MDKYDMQIDTLTYENDVLIYVVQDYDSIINGVPVMFLFATMTDSWNNKAELSVPETFVADVGVEFKYDVDAYDREGRILEFSSDSDLIHINKWSGKISFMPGTEDIGTYMVKIRVFDGIETTEKTVRLVVQ